MTFLLVLCLATPPEWIHFLQGGISHITKDWVRIFNVPIPVLDLADDNPDSFGMLDRTNDGPPVLEWTIDGKAWQTLDIKCRGGLWVARRHHRAHTGILPRVVPRRGKTYLVLFRLQGQTKFQPFLVEM